MLTNRSKSIKPITLGCACPGRRDTEKRVTLELDAGLHEIVLEQIVGAKGILCETGDTTVAIREATNCLRWLPQGI